MFLPSEGKVRACPEPVEGMGFHPRRVETLQQADDDRKPNSPSAPSAPSAVNTPDLLAIGHVARDLVGDGVVPGGAVTYAAHTAHALGLTAAIVTSARPGDLEPAPGVAAHVIPSAATTTFRNTYRDGRRIQTIEAVAGPIGPDDVPVGWRDARHVVIGPLANEIAPGVARLFPESVVVAALQGWLRQWDDGGIVSPRPWDGSDVLPHVDAAVVSVEDPADPSEIDRWAELTPVLIVTRGDRGARLHTRGEWYDIPPFPAREIDPTGAGDVFAAAYAVSFRETRDPIKAARFASAAASLSVRGHTTSAIPTRAEIHRLLEG